jgi:predicted outer membrane protein
LLALTDLQTGVTTLAASIATEIADVTAAIQASQASNNGSVSQADAESVVASLTTLNNQVQAEITALTPTPPAAT